MSQDLIHSLFSFTLDAFAFLPFCLLVREQTSAYRPAPFDEVLRAAQQMMVHRGCGSEAAGAFDELVGGRNWAQLSCSDMSSWSRRPSKSMPAI